MAKQPKRTRRTKRPSKNSMQEKALELAPVAEIVEKPFNEETRISRRVGTLWLNRSTSSGCPAFWSRELDKHLADMDNTNGWASLVAVKAANKFASRAFSIEPTQDSELSPETVQEMDELLLRGGNGGETFEEIAEKFAKSFNIYCNGGFIFVMGNSEEMEELPSELGFTPSDSRKVYGELAPLEGEAGNPLTYSDGTPIFAYGFKWLDTMHCTRTGNPDWPVIYSPLGNSEQYLLHHTRVIDMVFSPAVESRYNGVGKSSRYIALDTFRQLQGNQRVHLEFTGEDRRQAVMVIRKGPGAKEVREAWRGADERINNGDVKDNEIPVLGSEMGTQGDEEFILELIDINKLPDGFDWAEQLTHNMAVAGAAAYLSLADLGLSSLARMVSRANAEIEADSASSSGIPQLQETFAQLINRHLPEGVEFVWEPVNTRDAKEQAELDKIEADTLNSYVNSLVLSPLDVLDALYIKGDIPEEIYERRRAQLVAGTAASVDDSRKSIKKKAVEVSPLTDALDTSETDDLQNAFNNALIAQYLSANVSRIIRQARAEGVTDIEGANYIEQLIPFVEANTPALENVISESDEDEILSLLLLFALLGRNEGEEQVNRPLTAAELLRTQGQTNEWVALRLESLLGNNPEGFPVPASGQPLDIRNPLVPQGLDETSYRRIAELIRTSQQQSETIAGTVEAYEELVPQTTEGRAKVIAEDNASSAFGSGLWYYVIATQPLTKTWLRTVAPSPREVHLQQAGETVPIDATFSDGSFWSQSLVNCQCGIRVNYG